MICFETVWAFQEREPLTAEEKIQYIYGGQRPVDKREVVVEVNAVACESDIFVYQRGQLGAFCKGDPKDWVVRCPHRLRVQFPTKETALAGMRRLLALHIDWVYLNSLPAEEALRYLRSEGRSYLLSQLLAVFTFESTGQIILVPSSL